MEKSIYNRTFSKKIDPNLNFSARLRKISNTHALLKPVKYQLAHSYHNWVLRQVLKQSEVSIYTVLGMQRSGNHALIQWMMNGFQELSSFCNDLSPDQFPQEAKIKKSKWGLYTNPNLICSYENLSVNSVFSEKKFFPDNYSLKRILILRDPYNWASSWLAWQTDWGHRFREDSEYRRHLVHTWKEHAKFFLSIGNSQTNIGVNYNAWVGSNTYREKLASRLGLSKVPEQLSQIPYFGYGSSFKGVGSQMNVQGIEVDVLNRWKSQQTHPIFKEIQQDKELLDLSVTIFDTPISEAKD